MVKLSINGAERELDVAADTPLLWVIRDELGLTGTKFGCGMALCGACTVHVDGVATRSCVTAVGDVEGSQVTTIEAIARDGGATVKAARAVQTAWDKLDVVQCGYCQSGQVMSAVALLSENPKPSDDDIDAAMSGNVCRCATYVRIRAAIHEAAKLMEA